MHWSISGAVGLPYCMKIPRDHWIPVLGLRGRNVRIPRGEVPEKMERKYEIWDGALLAESYVTHDTVQRRDALTDRQDFDPGNSFCQYQAPGHIEKYRYVRNVLW